MYIGSPFNFIIKGAEELHEGDDNGKTNAVITISLNKHLNDFSFTDEAEIGNIVVTYIPSTGIESTKHGKIVLSNMVNN